MSQIFFCVNRRNLRIEVGAVGGGARFGLLNNQGTKFFRLRYMVVKPAYLVFVC
jgi:hypothetical protein